VVAAVGGELEKVVLLAAAGELLRRKEVVVDSVLLPGARLPGGRRDRELEVGAAIEQPLDQRSLADARGAGDDEDFGCHAAADTDRRGGRLTAQERDELGALALGEAADR